jgi:hypothetical protein
MADEVTVLIAIDAVNRSGKALDEAAGQIDSLGKHTDDLANRVDQDSKKIESRSSSMADHVGSAFSKAGNTLGNWGIPFSDSLSKMGEKIEQAKTPTDKLSATLGSIGKVASVGVVAGFAAASGEAVHLGEAAQASTAQLAASADISVAQAGKVQKAFQSTAFGVAYSAQQMMGAYTPLAGELAEITGHTLNAKDAMSVMAPAMDDAEASGADLGSTTKALAGTLLDVKAISGGTNQSLAQLSAESDVLYNTARLTGSGVSDIGSSIDRLTPKLIGSGTTVQQLGGLFVDLTQHLGGGKRAMLQGGTALQALISPSAQAQKVLAELGVSVTNAKGQFIGIGPAMDQLHAALEKLPPVSNNVAASAQATAVANQEQAVAAKIAALQADENTSGINDQVKALQQQEQQLNITAKAQGTKANAQQVAAIQQQILNLKESDNSAGLKTQIAALKGQESALKGQEAQLKTSGAALSQTSVLTTLFARNQKAMGEIIDAGSAGLTSYTTQVDAVGSAHAAAEKQSETLKHQTEQLTSGVEDLGAAYGEWLIPKLDDLAKILGESLHWLEQHKIVAEALAGVITFVLGVAIATFAYQTAAKFISSVGDMITGVGKLKDKIAGVGGESGMADEGETAAEALQNAARALESASEHLSAAAEKLQTAGSETASELEGAGSTVETDITTAGSAASTELEGAGAAVETDLETGAATASSEMDAAGATVATEEEAGGADGGAGMGAGGVASAAAVGVPLGIAGGHALNKAIAGAVDAPVASWLAPEEAVLQKGMASNSIAEINTDLKTLWAAGDQLQAALNKTSRWNPADRKNRDQLIAGTADVKKMWDQLYAHGEQVAAATVPSYDLGGIVTEDTLAILHANEVVLPLNDPGRVTQLLAEARPLMSNINTAPIYSSPATSPAGPEPTGGRSVTIYQQFLAAPMTAEQIASEVAWAMRQVA